MKRILGFIAGLIVLAGLGWGGWIFYWGVPTEPVSYEAWDRSHRSDREDPRCAKEWHNGNRYAGGPIECTDLLREEVLLRQTPSVASRTGKILTIFYRGRKVQDLFSADVSSPPNTCQSAVLVNVVKTRDETGNPDPLAEVLCAHGEFTERFVVLPDGTHLPSGNALASPDGHLIAAGTTLGPSLRIYQWPSGKQVAKFAVSCRPVEWKNNARFSANCGGVETWGRAFFATANQRTNGQWGLGGKQWAIYIFRWDAEGNLKFIPLLSWRPMPHYDPVPDSPSPTSK